MAVRAETPRSLSKVRALLREAASMTTEPVWPARLDAEVLRGCRAALGRLGGRAVGAIGVTSSLRGEGRSSISAGLALVEQKDHARSTVIVELDLEAPCLAQRFGVPTSPGVADVALGRCTSEEALRRLEDGLWLLVAGDVGGNAARIVSRLAGHELLLNLAKTFDVLIADLPPLLGDGPGLAASRLIDTLVLVARAGVTPLPCITEAAGRLPSPPMVILNGTASALPRWMRRVAGDVA